MQLGIILTLTALGMVASENVPILDKCKIKVEPVGCFKDVYGKRALTEQVLNGRDEHSNVKHNKMVDWTHYHAYLQEFLCSCAEKAFAKGYKVIGLQFYGECWAGPTGHKTFNKYGKSEDCITQDMSKPPAEQYRKCSNDIVCTGERLTNYVYRVAPSSCDTYYEPVGCYKDDLVEPRPFPKYIMNKRDYGLSNFNGHLINWHDWDTYSPEMICRCAKKAKELGMVHFGLQFYGECWGGEEDEKKISRAGPVEPGKCVAQNFKLCPYNSYHCVGTAKVNAVYRLIEGPTKNAFATSRKREYNRVEVAEEHTHHKRSSHLHNKRRHHTRHHKRSRHPESEDLVVVEDFDEAEGNDIEVK